MAKGKKTGGRDWKPGQSGNPAGRAKLPAWMRESRSMNKEKFHGLLNEYIHRPATELVEIMKDPTTPTLELMVIKVVMEAIKHGDEKKLGFLLDRLIGKVREEVHVSGQMSVLDLAKKYADQENDDEDKGDLDNGEPA